MEKSKSFQQFFQARRVLNSLPPNDTGWYYLQSRYYDPIVKRFLNADTFASTGQGFLGYNMYTYCANNPITHEDLKGESFTGTTTVFDQTFELEYGISAKVTVSIDATIDFCDEIQIEIDWTSGEVTIQLTHPDQSPLIVRGAFSISASSKLTSVYLELGKSQGKAYVLRGDLSGVWINKEYTYEYCGYEITLSIGFGISSWDAIRLVTKDIADSLSGACGAPGNAYSANWNAIGGAPVTTVGGGATFLIMQIR